MPVEIVEARKQPVELETVSAALIIDPPRKRPVEPRPAPASGVIVEPRRTSPEPERVRVGNEPRLTRQGFFVYYYGQEEAEEGKISR